MSVLPKPVCATKTLTAQTVTALTAAFVNKDLLEMEELAKVLLQYSKMCKPSLVAVGVLA